MKKQFHHPLICIFVLFLLKLNAQAQWNLNGNATSGEYIGTTNTQPFPIRTNNLERMIVAANGNVGIGISSPNYLLHVNYKPNTAGDVYMQFTNTSAASASTNGLLVGMDASNNGIINMQDAAPIEFFTSGLQYAIIDDIGNVGIGTSFTAPICKLHVQNNHSGTAVDAVADFNNVYFSLNGTTGPLGATGATGVNVGAVVTSSGNNPNIGTISIAHDVDALLNVGLFSMAQGGPSGALGASGVENGNVALWGKAQWTGRNDWTSCNGVIGEIKGRGVGVVGCVNIDESEQLPAMVFKGGSATGTIALVKGVVGEIWAHNGAVIPYAAAFEAEFETSSTGPTGYTGPLGINTGYGIVIDDVPASVVGYGVFQKGTDDINYFAGKVGIGTATPSFALDVNGTVAAKQFVVATETETKDLLVMIEKLRKEVEDLKCQMVASR